MRIGIGTTPANLHLGGVALALSATLAGLAAIPLLRWPSATPSDGIASFGLAAIGRWSPAFMPSLPFVLLALATLTICAGYATVLLSNRDRTPGPMAGPLRVASWSCLALGITCSWAGILGMTTFLRHGMSQDHWGPYLLGNTVAGLGLVAAGVSVILVALVPLLGASRRGARPGPAVRNPATPVRSPR